jgi:hypothetical protein
MVQKSVNQHFRLRGFPIKVQAINLVDYKCSTDINT